MIEYAVRDEEGSLVEWACGCPKAFESIATLEAYVVIEETDTIMCREVGEWKPVKQ